MKKVVYVVGAGASTDVNLPTGHQLKGKISNLLNINFADMFNKPSGDSAIHDAIRIQAQKEKANSLALSEYDQTCSLIRDAMHLAPSIDNFIDVHKDDKKVELCGKLAIVRSILAAEKSSHLYINPSNIYNTLKFPQIEDTWYVSFFKTLVENCSIEKLPERLKDISLIVFNYDRCIEHFLYNALQKYYGITAHKSAAIVNTIKIYHPYGVVGCLPWQEGISIDFGANPSPQLLLDLASQIKTFTEGTDPSSSEIVALREDVGQAHQIVFLGFAFHKLNMQLIYPVDKVPNRSTHTTYIATAIGFSNIDCGIIQGELEQFKEGGNRTYIDNNSNCTNLFSAYSRYLSLS